METILIIDDEIDLVFLLKDALSKNGYKVLSAYNGFDGIEMSKMGPDLIVLDIMMPDLDGISVCNIIRDNVDCPILFLSAKDTEEDRIKGLAIGGDDYITKPFSLAEFIVRIKAHLRREKRNQEAQTKLDFLKFNNLTIDIKAKSVFINGLNTNLTKTEYNIVELLALNPRQVFSKDQIYDKVWGFDGLGSTSTVTEHIKKIRFKFNSLDPNLDYIFTVWGIGYKWEE